jgi:predicted RNase H-like HicB family nuclease
MALQRTIRAVIKPGEESGYVGVCDDIFVVTQGETLDEVTKNLKEAIELYFEDEDVESLGFTKNPVILVTFEMEAAVA